MSLADKLAALTNPDPGFEDPEKDTDVTAAKVTEYDVELDVEDTDYLTGKSARSILRTKNADLTGDDTRYAGKKTSRKKISQILGAAGFDDVDEVDDDFREHAAAELGNMFEGLDDMGEEDSEDERGSEADDDNQEESYDISNNDRDGSQNDNGFVFDASDQDFNRYGDMEGEDATDEDISDEEVSENQDDNDQNEHDEEEEEEEKDDSALGISSVGSNVTSEIKKGKCVARQLKFWDKLLETRIQEQKILTKVNSLPVGGYWGKIVNAGDVEVQEAMKDAQTSLKILLNDLQYLELLLKEGPDTEPPAKRKKLSEFGCSLQESHKSYKHERNTIIEKWNDKTRIVTGKDSFASFDTSRLQQIEQILANSDRLIQRTRLKRSNYIPVGRGNNFQEIDVDIFDDNDFYHQLLKDLIDRKATSTSDGAEMTRQWLEVQKLRTKLKKNVDQKASKGRKLRYDIHKKMVNFMAPIYNTLEDKEETKNELFSSLFGARRS
jgi:protein AATF/BFR2